VGSTIQLNIINNSSDAENSKILVFQKSAAPGAAEAGGAWHVIKNSRPGESHRVVLPGSDGPPMISAPSIYIGAMPSGHGEIAGPSVHAERAKEIPLADIASADIVMTGGGSGADAAPYQFTLRNVVKA
jgi:hypothetical protein